MSFNMLFYTIFGTNLLTEGQVPVYVFLPILVFHRRGISHGIKPSGELFWNKRDLGDSKWTTRNQRGGHEAGRRACPPGRAPHPRGPLAAPPTYFFLLYIPIYPETIQEHHENLFPPSQPSVPVRSHLGAFSGTPPEGHRSWRASTSTP